MHCLFNLLFAALLALWTSTRVQAGSPLSRGIFQNDLDSKCSIAVLGALPASNESWTDAVRSQVQQAVELALISDPRCSCAARTNASELTLTWMQYPGWFNAAFTDWIWNLKTDPGTAPYFSHLVFEGPQTLPIPAAITSASIMRDYAAVHNDDAVVYSTDLSGFPASSVVDQKGVLTYPENACLQKSDPRGPLHPRTFLLLFYRPDALAAMHAAGVTPSAAPPDDWEEMLSLLKAHAAAVRTPGNSTSGSATRASLPSQGLCIAADPGCGRLGDVLAAMAASAVQSYGTHQGYAFDTTAPPLSAVPLVNGTAWRYAADLLRQMIQYNAPEYGNASAASGGRSSEQLCNILSPWFESGDCLMTIEWDVAVVAMAAAPILRRPGALAVAPLPGSRMVMNRRVHETLLPCNASLCAVSGNHDLLYLTSAGQQPAVLAAAASASAKCSFGEVARMEAAAAAVATASSLPYTVNRAPYSALFDYYVYIDYQRIALYNFGREMSLIQLNIASRMENERVLRQTCMNALRTSLAATSATPANDTPWHGAVYASTPWWAALGLSASGDASTATGGLPPEVLAPYVSRGLEATAAASYIRALWHAVHSPNLAPDIAAPAMVNWYKWGLSHAALALLPFEPTSTNGAIGLLARVFDLVNEAHTATLVRSMYEASIGAARWQVEPPSVDDTGRGKEGGMSGSALAALVSSVVAGVLLTGLLVLLLLRLRNRHRNLLGRVVAPRAGQDTTLLISDVQSSTALWEQLPVAVMDAALRIHHRTVRHLLSQYDGYESATEGDSFILAFADPASAVAFAAACQVELMLQEWPQELLEHPDAEPVLTDPQDGEVAQQAAVPGSDGLRLGSRSPLPRTFLARLLTSPMIFIGSRLRAAAVALRGTPVAPVPPATVRPLYGNMYDMSTMDMSVYSGAFCRRSVDTSSRPLNVADNSVRLPGAVQTHLPPDGVDRLDGKAHVALASTGGGGGTAATVIATIEVTGGGSGDGSRNLIPTKSVAFQGVPASPRRAVTAAESADVAEAGIGRKVFAARDRGLSGGNTSPLPPSLASPGGPGACRPSTPWGAALEAAFPLVSLHEAPMSVLTAQELKSPWVLLPSGRLVLLAYRGLRVRMGIHTGLDDPQYVAFNKVGSSFKYYGPFAEMAKCATEAAPGAMVVLSSQAFARLRNCMSASAGGRHYDVEAVVIYAGHHVLKAAAAQAGSSYGKLIQLPPQPRPAVPQLAVRVSRASVSAIGAEPAIIGVGAAAAASEGMALYEAVPAALVCRLALSPPLVSTRTVQLGSLAAPTGFIIVAFMNVVGAATLLADLPGPAARALDEFQRLVCRLLDAKGGYLVEGGDGLVLAAFGNSTAAVEWALDCVAGLKKLDWEAELLNHWLCEEVLSVGLVGADALSDREEAASPPNLPVTTVFAGSRRGSSAGGMVPNRRGPSAGVAGDGSICASAASAAGDGGGGDGVEGTDNGCDAAPTPAAADAAEGSGGSGEDASTRPNSVASVSTVHSCAPPLPSLNSNMTARRSLRRALSRMPSMAHLGSRATTTRVLERGLRIKVGLDAGSASHSLNAASGRLSYRGKVMNRASRVAGKAAAGQVLCTDIVWRGCLEGPSSMDSDGSDSNPGSGLVGVSLGRVVLKGVSQPVELIQCMRAS